MDLGHSSSSASLLHRTVTADNMALLRFIEDSGMFPRAG
jgi:hypothetical protein